MFLHSGRRDSKQTPSVFSRCFHLNNKSLNRFGSVTQAGHLTLRTTYIMTVMLLKKKKGEKYIGFYLFVFLKASVMILLSSTEGLLPQSQIQNDFMMIKLSDLSDCGLKLKRPFLTFILNNRFIYIQIKYALKTPRRLEGEDAQFVCQGPCLTPSPPPRTATLEERCSLVGYR